MQHGDDKQHKKTFVIWPRVLTRGRATASGYFVLRVLASWGGNDDNLSVESDSYPALDTARDRGSFIRHNEALGRWKKVREELSWGRAWVPMVSGVQCRVEPHLGTPPLTVLWDASRPFIAAIGAIGHCWCWCVNNYIFRLYWGPLSTHNTP